MNLEFDQFATSPLRKPEYCIFEWLQIFNGRKRAFENVEAEYATLSSFVIVTLAISFLKNSKPQHFHSLLCLSSEQNKLTIHGKVEK